MFNDDPVSMSKLSKERTLVGVTTLPWEICLSVSRTSRSISFAAANIELHKPVNFRELMDVI